MDRDAAANLLEDELTERLKRLVGTDGQVLKTDFQTRVSDGLIYVTVFAECLEEIGQELCADTEERITEDQPPKTRE